MESSSKSIPQLSVTTSESTTEGSHRAASSRRGGAYSSPKGLAPCSGVARTMPPTLWGCASLAPSWEANRAAPPSKKRESGNCYSDPKVHFPWQLWWHESRPNPVFDWWCVIPSEVPKMNFCWRDDHVLQKESTGTTSEQKELEEQEKQHGVLSIEDGYAAMKARALPHVCLFCPCMHACLAMCFGPVWKIWVNLWINEWVDCLTMNYFMCMCMYENEDHLVLVDILLYLYIVKSY